MKLFNFVLLSFIFFFIMPAGVIAQVFKDSILLLEDFSSASYDQDTRRWDDVNFFLVEVLTI